MIQWRLHTLRTVSFPPPRSGPSPASQWRTYRTLRGPWSNSTSITLPPDGPQLGPDQLTPLVAFSRKLRQLLKDRRIEDASSHLYKTLTQEKLDNPTRFHVFSSAIGLFLQFRFMRDAYHAFNRMQDEGYIPSVNARAPMMVLEHLKYEERKTALVNGARKAFELEGADEATLRWLLRVIVRNIPCTSEDVAAIVSVFLETRPDGYTLSAPTWALLASLHVRLKDLGGAWRSFAHIKDADPQYLSSNDIDRSSLMKLAHGKPSLLPAILSAIPRLNKLGAEQDRLLLNMVIETFRKEYQYGRAFETYQILKRGDAHNYVFPDASTYQSLFNILRVADRRRGIHTRKAKRLVGAPEPRRLFCEMMFEHFKKTQGKSGTASHVVTSAVLTTALRTFMEKDDYPAAYVALEAFRMCGMDVTIYTYRAVILQLLRRMDEELPGMWRREERDRGWTYRFMLRPPLLPISTADIRVAEGVLQLSAQRDTHLPPFKLPPENWVERIMRLCANASQDGTIRGRTRRLYWLNGGLHIPSTLAVMGVVRPATDTWDLTPLLRLIRRAVWATPRGTADQEYIEQQIGEARQQMIYSISDFVSEDEVVETAGQESQEKQERKTKTTGRKHSP